MSNSEHATFTLRIPRDQLDLIKNAAAKERRSANAFVLEAVSSRLITKNNGVRKKNMKMHIDYSQQDCGIELCFSDGQYLSLTLEQADKMKQCLSAAICLTLTNGEDNGGWEVLEKDIECSDFKKEF